MASYQRSAVRYRVYLQAVLVVITLCGLPPLQASSVLNFPRLSFEAGTLTGLAIVNPNDQSADVTLTAYNADGSILGVNQEPITIAANSQFAALVSDIFSGDPATVGWIQATSTTDNLTGFFLFFNDTTPFNLFDGADLPEAAPEIVFTQVRIDSGYTTELNLINLGSTTTNLQLDLISSGASVATQSLSLFEKGAARLEVADFFQISQVSSDAYVTVISDGDIAGFELVRSATGDLVGLNAKQASQQLTHLYFPQMLVLGGVQTSVGVVNNSDQAVILTFTAFKPDGSLYDTEDLQNPTVTEALNPGAILVRDLEALFGFSGSEIRDGWLQVESSAPAVTGYLTYELPALGAAATVTANAAGQTRGIFSHIATIEGLFTGVAVLNPGQLVANVLIVAVRKDGTVLGSTSVLLQPGERISELLGNPPPGLIEEAAEQGDGYVFISSDLPVYLTSLFGDNVLNVLSNIPPQDSPEGFDPAAGIPILQVTPVLSIVQPGQPKVFQVVGDGQGAVWSVNGTPGGDSTVGTIDNQGNYTAPAQVPAESPTVTISATVNNQTAGASLDILDKQALFTSVSIVQSVVYLGSLQNLYTAELTILSGSGSGAEPARRDPAQEVVESEIFTVPEGFVKTTLANFPNEEISKMISLTASNGQQFLLLAAKNTGRVLRLDPTNGAIQEVATGLNEPSSLVIDPVSGNLLVAEKTQITSIPKADLEVGLSAALRTLPDTDRQALVRELFPTDAADGIAVDRCTGDVFFSKRLQGALVRFRRLTGKFQILFTGLGGPTQLLAIYRRGVSCPDAFQLLVIEQGADRLLLLRPGQGSTVSFISARGSTDITFLPRGTPFASREGILLTEATDPDRVRPDTISTVPVPETYQDEPVNAPVIEPLGISTVSSLPGGTVGAVYSDSLEARGGVPPYSWSLISGGLPPDLTLSAEGLITGLATQEGTFDFRARVTDDEGNFAEKNFRIRIDAPEPEPGAATVVELAFSSQQRIVIDCGTAGGLEYQVSEEFQLTGHVSHNGQTLIRGPLSGTITSSFQGTGLFSDASDPCTNDAIFEGVFEAGISQPGSPEPTDVSGTWDFKVIGVSSCDDGTDEAGGDMGMLEVTQVGNQVSATLVLVDDTPDVDFLLPPGCSVTCSATGECTASCPDQGFSCSITCDPATSGCGEVFQITGAVREEPEPPPSAEVQFTALAESQLVIACTDAASSRQDLQFSLVAQFEGSSIGSVPPIITGSFSGTDVQSCQLTGAFADNPCEGSDAFTGFFGVLITPTEPSQSPTDLSGSWTLLLLDDSDEEEGEAIQFDVTQVGDRISASGLDPDRGEDNFSLSPDCTVTCPSPGECTAECPEFGSCSITCNPATSGCLEEFQINGTVR